MNGTILTKDSLIPLGVAMAAVLAIGSGTWRAATALTEINYELRAIRTQLDVTVTKQEFNMWLLRLKAQNPNLDAPALMYFSNERDPNKDTKR